MSTTSGRSVYTPHLVPIVAERSIGDVVNSETSRKIISLRCVPFFPTSSSDTAIDANTKGTSASRHVKNQTVNYLFTYTVREP